MIHSLLYTPVQNDENRADPSCSPCLGIRRPHLLLEVWVHVNTLRYPSTDLLPPIHQAKMEVPCPTGFPSTAATSPAVLSGLEPRFACPLSCPWPSQRRPSPLAGLRHGKSSTKSLTCPVMSAMDATLSPVAALWKWEPPRPWTPPSWRLLPSATSLPPLRSSWPMNPGRGWCACALTSGWSRIYQICIIIWLRNLSEFLNKKMQIYQAGYLKGLIIIVPDYVDCLWSRRHCKLTPRKVKLWSHAIFNKRCTI